MPAAYLEKLNSEQRRAVEHGVRENVCSPTEPLLVIAGAGSGKTNTLAHRVAHFIVNGVDPRRILLMTFSRRAASEMTRRVERIWSQALGANAGIMTDALSWAGTFHGIGARLLRDYAEQIGLDPGFTIHDREDSADLMNLVRHQLGLSKTESRFPTKGTCLAIYSRAVNAELPLGDVLGGVYPWCAGWEKQLRELFALYVEAKQTQNVLDYDDLLLYWAQTMSDPRLAEDIGGRFSHVLVDEYQDTNRLQALILLALKPGGRGLTVVGDDAQSIYSFRAATVRNILDFPNAFSPAANVITLDRNYRSTQPILAAANGVIGLAAERFTKNLWTERQSAERPQLVSVRDEADQASYIVERVLENREAGTGLKQQAVLFRTSHHSGPLEVELTRRNIPFVKFGGLKFLDSAHVKDMLAMLRFAQNPRDRVAGFRLMQLIPGVGPSSARRVLDLMAGHADPLSALSRIPAPPRSGEHWNTFVDILQQLHIGGAGWPAEMEYARRWYEPHLERVHEDAAVRQADLLQLEQIAAGYPSRERFLTELTLDPPDATSDQAGVPLRDEDYLILSTIHSAKGQEWKSVFVLNVVDGCIPSDLGAGTTPEIEEERRLLYVAMTRAKDSLHLVVPHRFFTHGQNAQGDRHVYASRTRFIPAALTQHFECVTWPLATAVAGRRQDAREVRVDIGGDPMCNLYSVTKGQQAIRELSGAMSDRTGNLPLLPGIYPDYRAPIVRNRPDGRELILARWGMPSPQTALKGRKADPGVTNIRNVKSPHWRRWLGIEHRCVVPFTSFSENEALPDGRKPPVWFAFDETRPLALFAGLWTSWTSVRKVKEGETTNDLFGFLTTEANKRSAPSTPKRCQSYWRRGRKSTSG